MTSRVEISIKKADAAQQIVFGEVYVPDVNDSQGDRMTAEEIQKTAYLFMQKGRLAKIDTNHNLKVNGSYVVENFIARDGDPTFIPGSWVVGVKIPDKATWEMVEKGELNGFSFDGSGFREEVEVEIVIPEEVTGLTSLTKSHAHQFIVKFDSETGAFLGGQSDEVDGHSHKITTGTLTDEVDGHTHTFSYVEGFLHVAD